MIKVSTSYIALFHLPFNPKEPIRYAYDKRGNITKQTDDKGGITRTTYDLAGQMVEVEDALGNRPRKEETEKDTIEYRYNALNQLQEKNQGENQTTYAYAKARYYQAEDGRFLSEDAYHGNTSEEGNWNRYVYVKK